MSLLTVEEKRSHLAQLLRQKNEGYRSGPLSFAQQRLWFLDQYTPDSSAYNIFRAFSITGPLSVIALEQSLNDLVQRHEALRTTFRMVNSQPIQLITAVRFSLPCHDLCHLAPVERETEVQRWANEEAHRPFNLATGPLLRTVLLQLDAENHMLLLTMHHIISDGWSMSTFTRELATLYQAHRTNQAASLPALPIQYLDYAQWQRRWLQGERLEKQLAYWQHQLAGAPPLLELPTNHPRPLTQTFRGGHLPLSLPQPLTHTLLVLSQQEGVTLFITLLAAFQVLLHHMSGQDDIVVGTPIAGRHRSETEGLIGFFVNTLVMRTDLSGNPTFRHLLRQVREVALGAYDHQDLPFEKLVEALAPERNPAHHPLFQVMFALQNTPPATLKLPGLTLQTVPIERRTATFDLSLLLSETAHGLEGVIEYNTDLFEEATIQRMAGHFQTLLQGIVVNPDQPIGELPLLTTAERQQLLVEWNATQADFPRHLCLHQLFEAQVERTPDAIAVVFHDQQLTYAGLNGRANQLAHHLHKLGIAPGTEALVGICVERSLEMVIGLLGILKAGAAYVPLDPAYPQERLAFMLEDAQIRVLLTQQKVYQSIAAGVALVNGIQEVPVTLVDLDNDWGVIAQEGKHNPSHTILPQNLAYLIYTSGSTGKPKGVMVEHRSVVNYMFAANTEYNLGADDRVLQFASINFDASAEEIYPCLSRGATLLLRDDAMLDTVETFLRQCEEWQISVLNLPTAYWHEVAANLETADITLPSSVRLVIIGGESVLSERLAAWYKHVNQQVRLVNTYGPTEATIVTTLTDLTNVAEPENKSYAVSIGRPVRNAQVYVLDRYLQPVPIGVKGELYIGGAGLARGYLHQPELTAERFLNYELGIRNYEGEGTSPFIIHPSSFIIYKTGDLVRYRPDGNLEFLGRVDHQVKIRGFRIELGEIEVVLNSHPAVHAAVVVTREDKPGEKYLAAYVVMRDSEWEKENPTANCSLSPVHQWQTKLRSFLHTRLPAYMVPATFMFLEALPLTPAGKLDRRALPMPEHTYINGQNEVVPPRDHLERQLIQIWEQVLNVRPIGIRHNFFELGGHSLLAVRVIGQIEKTIGRKLSLAVFFRAPTISRMAEMLRLDDPSLLFNPSPTSPLVTIQPGGSKRPFFCIHPAGGDLFSYNNLARHLGEDQPFYMLQIPEQGNQEISLGSIEQIAASFVEAITAIQPEGPYLLGGWSSGVILALEMAQQLWQDRQQVVLLANLDGAPWPALFQQRPLRDDLGLLTALAHQLVVAAGKDQAHVRIAAADLRQIPPEGWLHYVVERLQHAGVHLDESGVLRIQRAWRLLSAYHRVMVNYKLPRYIGSMTVFRATENKISQEMAVFDELEAPTLGWERFCAGSVKVVTTPGNHFTMMAEPHVHTLAEHLQAYLAG